MSDALAGGFADVEASGFAAVLPDLLARAGFDRSFVRQCHDRAGVRLPAESRSYLRRTNPRLEELTRRYAGIRHRGVCHSLWNPSYVAAEVPLHAFRADCAFIWQHRDLNLPVNYALTYFYLKASPVHAGLLARLGDDDLFGPYTLSIANDVVTRDRLDSVLEIAFLDRHLGIRGRPVRVLDIGSGYGRLAHRLAESIPGVQVACVDAVAESTFICEHYLQVRNVTDRVRVVPLDEVKVYLDDSAVDVAVNVHSFSECRADAVAWWLDLLQGHAVEYLMIVPNPLGDHGAALVSTEGHGEHRDLLSVIARRGYELVAMEPKFQVQELQRYGVTPTHYFLFRQASRV